MENRKKISGNVKIILAQAVFLIIVFVLIYVFYPRASIGVDGDLVNFASINAKVIMISNNPDFSNPRYFDVSDIKNFSFRLKPGEYYWKSDNGLIESRKRGFEIDSEVGLDINRSEDTELVNVGNVKINVTKGEGGVMVGHVILEPEESEEIKDKGEYTGREVK